MANTPRFNVDTYGPGYESNDANLDDEQVQCLVSFSRKFTLYEMTKPLTTSERKALRAGIEEAKQALAVDKATRPKKKPTQKQLDALAIGRAKNSRFHPKPKDTYSTGRPAPMQPTVM